LASPRQRRSNDDILKGKPSAQRADESPQEYVVQRIRKTRRKTPASLIVGGLVGVLLFGGLLVVLAVGTGNNGRRPTNPTMPAQSAPLQEVAIDEPTPSATIPPDFATQLAQAPSTFTPNPQSPSTEEATSVLPQEYINLLSATPPPPEEIITPTPIPADIVQPTFTPAFVAAAPQFDLRISKIVFVCKHDLRDDEICIMNADGTELKQLTFNTVTDWYPSFSYDGQWIVYSSQRNGQFDIHMMDLDGQNNRQITRGLGENYAPALSPDGSQIVFTSTYGPGPDQNIWIVNSDGSDPHQITFSDRDDVDPIWSPDGTQISYASNRSGTAELHVMYPDGTNVRQLTSGVNIGGRNDWSHDGRYFTFYAGPPADMDIWLLDAACAYTLLGCISEPIQLTDGGHNKGPSFSPDSKWVTYASQADKDGDNEVFITNVETGETHQLTFNNAPDWQPRWSP